MSNNIESVMHEDRVFEPPKEFAAKARIGSMAAYQAMCDEAAADYPGFWAKRAREELSWKKPFTRVLDETCSPPDPDGNIGVVSLALESDENERAEYERRGIQ